jgi:hypothetical protein
MWRRRFRKHPERRSWTGYAAADSLAERVRSGSLEGPLAAYSPFEILEGGGGVRGVVLFHRPPKYSVDVGLLRHFENIIDLSADVPNRAFQLLQFTANPAAARGA